LIVRVPLISAGKYTLIVDVFWDASADKAQAYKEVNVRMFTGEQAALTRIEKSQGYTTLFKALKIKASSAQNEQIRQFYRPEFGK